MANLVDTLAGNQNDQDSLKRSTVTKSNIQNRTQVGSSSVKVIDMPEVREAEDIQNLFILDSAKFGILDTSAFATSSGTLSVDRINNPNKIWRWLMSSLENDYWVDS